MAFEEPDFALIDTLFSLAEAFLFMQLVEIHDAQPTVLPAGKQYADLYRCVGCDCVVLWLSCGGVVVVVWWFVTVKCVLNHP